MDVISYIIGRQSGKTPLQEKTLDITANGTTEALPDAGFALSKVIVNTNVESGGGGAELNIAYGDTAPEDTSKLWVKTAEPSKVIVSSELETASGAGGVSKITTLSTRLPNATDGIASAPIGTKVYLFGGYSGSYLDTINRFNAETETITTLSTRLPTGANSIASALIDTKVYLFGGFTGSDRLNTINCFDTETETITTLSTRLPAAATGIASAPIGTKVYLFGGSLTSGRLNTINCFDTETETITTLSTTLGTAASGIASAPIDTKVYLFGGYAGSRLTTINCFDTETETITTLSTRLPAAAHAIASTPIGTKVYLFGGYSTTRLSTINCFDTETETITTLSTRLPAGANGIASAPIGTKVYLFGGRKEAVEYLDTINCFEGDSIVLAENAVQLVPSLSKNVFSLINVSTVLVKIGVSVVYKGNAEGIGENVEAALYKDSAWTNI